MLVVTTIVIIGKAFIISIYSHMAQSLAHSECINEKTLEKGPQRYT